jgi:hypothetical protein
MRILLDSFQKPSIKKKDRIAWIKLNQNMIKHIPNHYPQSLEGRRLLRNVADAMIRCGLYRPQPLSTLDMSVLNLIKEYRKQQYKETHDTTCDSRQFPR